MDSYRVTLTEDERELLFAALALYEVDLEDRIDDGPPSPSDKAELDVLRGLASKLANARLGQ